MHTRSSWPSATSAKMSKALALLKLVIPTLLVGLGLLFFMPTSGASPLVQRSLLVQNPQPNVTTTYEFVFTILDATNVGSVSMQFCDNSPLEGFPCNPPSGMDASGISLEQISGFNDLTITSTTANSILLSRPSTPVAAPMTVDFKLHNLVNPSAAGSYYARVSTYSSVDGTGPSVGYGGLAFSLVPLIGITTEVPPYLLFCTGTTVSGLDCGTASGSYINFGNISPQRTKSAESQMLLATNAANGYNITINGNTLTSGNNVISGLTAQDVSRPGVSQFGINLRANADPVIGSDVSGPGSGQPVAPYATPNSYAFHTGDIVAFSGAVEDYRKYTVSYIVNMSQGQPAGVYVSTLSYVATANF